MGNSAKEGGLPAGLSDRAASPEVMAQALATVDYEKWQGEFLQ